MKTERLKIEKLNKEDKLGFFNNITHDKNVIKTFMCEYNEKIEELDFDKYLKIDNLFSIKLNNNEFIGIILICKIEGKSCEIGYAIGTSYSECGYATEAVSAFINYCFKELDMKRVEAGYFVGNEKSKRVMEKCKMKYLCSIEKEIKYLGEDKDIVYYYIEK